MEHSGSVRELLSRSSIRLLLGSLHIIAHAAKNLSLPRSLVVADYTRISFTTGVCAGHQPTKSDPTQHSSSCQASDAIY